MAAEQSGGETELLLAADLSSNLRFPVEQAVDRGISARTPRPCLRRRYGDWLTEGEDALRAYRKFLKGDLLVEANTEAMTLLERLPPKIHKIQEELPAWMQKTGNTDKTAALMTKLQEQLKARNFEEVEKTADSILKMMGLSAPASAQGSENRSQKTPPSSPLSDDPAKRLTEKVARVAQGVQKWTASGRDPSAIAKAMQEKVKPLMDAGKVVEAEAELDRVLEQLAKDAK